MERHRIDHWLKLCCIYKQRSEATRACEAGHVKVNGRRIKPSLDIRVDDVIEIDGNHYRKFVVLGLPSGSVSKEVARTLYRDETPPPPQNDKDDWFAAAMAKAPRREKGAGRPTKRERRDIDRLDQKRER